MPRLIAGTCFQAPLRGLGALGLELAAEFGLAFTVPVWQSFLVPVLLRASCAGPPLTIIKEYTENQKHPG
ncbi:hypothetical protein [Streptomyces oceani]|uniref:Uncharacterized protein n=1 Tax=Streptomyces oceani TaxID=1075402 RepID=A0A1E7KIM0_9ACTN|nr:hypothetical protein [Streptomyces oceani]OEV03694.1 hypothetical protein AN216_10620 [Streptomyces oceani]